MENKEKFYITTPIYYPSGKFHIGTAYCEVMTDAIKRYKQARGYDAFMLTGLDEHGQKIQTVAEKRGKTPQEHVDELAEEAIKLWKLMDIDYDDFLRTTETRHQKAVQKIVKKFLENGNFPLILTTCNFRYLESILPKYNYEDGVIAYQMAENANQDIPSNVINNPLGILCYQSNLIVCISAISIQISFSRRSLSAFISS